MGWGRFFLLGNLGQQLDLMDQKQEMDGLRLQLAAHRQGAPSAAPDLPSLQRENDELKLYLAALFRLLAAKGIASPAEIRALVTAVDTEDGAGDGRFRGEILPKE